MKDCRICKKDDEKPKISGKENEGEGEVWGDLYKGMRCEGV